MEKDLLYKAIGIIIIVALAGSMLAGALVYMPEDDSSQNAPLPQNTNAYDYEVSFDTNVLKELNSIRVYAETSSLDKTEIDLEIQKLDGISRIRASEFRSAGQAWAYFAEIDLRKDASAEEVTDSIFAMDFFNGAKQAMKRVGISTPNEVLELKNEDLNITRNFTFEYPETFAIASLETLKGDEINVSGTIRLQGKEIVSIELIENNNLSAQAEYFSVEEEFEILELKDELFFEANSDNNIDKNYYQEQLQELDANATVFVHESTLYGQTVADKEELEEILFDLNNVTFKQAGTIFVDTLFVEDLNREIAFGEETQIELNYGRSIGDKILAEIMLAVSRTSEEIMQVVEKE